MAPPNAPGLYRLGLVFPSLIPSKDTILYKVSLALAGRANSQQIKTVHRSANLPNPSGKTFKMKGMQAQGKGSLEQRAWQNHATKERLLRRRSEACEKVIYIFITCNSATATLPHVGVWHSGRSYFRARPNNFCGDWATQFSQCRAQKRHSSSSLSLELPRLYGAWLSHSEKHESLADAWDGFRKRVPLTG